jgi:hypothetical protein
MHRSHAHARTHAHTRVRVVSHTLSESSRTRSLPHLSFTHRAKARALSRERALRGEELGSVEGREVGGRALVRVRVRVRACVCVCACAPLRDAKFGTFSASLFTVRSVRVATPVRVIVLSESPLLGPYLSESSLSEPTLSEFVSVRVVAVRAVSA